MSLRLGLFCLLFCVPAFAQMGATGKSERTEAFGLATIPEVENQAGTVRDAVGSSVSIAEDSRSSGNGTEERAEAKDSAVSPLASGEGNTKQEIAAPRTSPGPQVRVVDRGQRRSRQSVREAEKTCSVGLESSGVSYASTTEAASTTNRQDRVAFLQKVKQESLPARQGTGVGIKAVFWTLLKLGFVLLLAYSTILILKWLSNRREFTGVSSRELHVVDTLRLSPTVSLHLVEAKGRLLLLGCSTGQVNVLQEMPTEESEDPSGESSSRFAEYLAKYSVARNSSSPAGRLSRLVRDCARYLRSRCTSSQCKAGDDYDT